MQLWWDTVIHLGYRRLGYVQLLWWQEQWLLLLMLLLLTRLNLLLLTLLTRYLWLQMLLQQL
jgi:hypothetical protein